MFFSKEKKDLDKKIASFFEEEKDGQVLTSYTMHQVFFNLALQRYCFLRGRDIENNDPNILKDKEELQETVLQFMTGIPLIKTFDKIKLTISCPAMSTLATFAKFQDQFNYIKSFIEDLFSTADKVFENKNEEEKTKMIADMLFKQTFIFYERSLTALKSLINNDVISLTYGNQDIPDPGGLPADHTVELANFAVLITTALFICLQAREKKKQQNFLPPVFRTSENVASWLDFTM